MSFYSDASLVLIPSGYKDQKIYCAKPTDGSADLTFSRASSATRVQSDGLIEKVRTNLLQQSQNLAAAAWSLGGTATRTANYGTAPDGTQTSTRIQWTNAAGFELYQYTGFAAPIYGSVYIKGTNGQTIKYSGNSVTLNGSWQRIQGAIAIDGANTFFTIVGTTGVNTAFDFELWGAQAETGDIATDYIATTTAAVSVGPVSGLPRLDYLGSTCPRLLLEPQRTNTSQFSEQMDNAYWQKSDVTISANNAVSPDGYTNADKINENTANGLHYIASGTGQMAAANTYTASVFLKASERSFGWLYIYNGTEAGGLSAFFNLSNGTLGTIDPAITATITNYGNGWYRCTATRVLTGSASAGWGFGTATANGTNSYQGVSGSGILAYGAALEIGAYATSYIPTLGASVTRVADACSKTGISSLIGQTEGTLYAEIVRTQSTAADTFWITLSDGSINNWLFIGTEATGGRMYVRASNTVIFDQYPAISVGTHKIALAYKSGSIAVYIDGAQIFTSAATYTIGSLTGFALGQSQSTLTASVDTAGAVKQALLFKTRLTNTQLAELTA